jgi:nucleotide-binding universal stress UspA family protein
VFKRVLLCFDGSTAGRRALRKGAELAIFAHAEVHLLAIVPNGAADPVTVAAAAGQISLVVDGSGDLNAMLDESVKRLEARGVVAHGHLARGNAIDEIVTYAQRLGVDLIVLGHYPQPSGGFWWWAGGQRASLAERARCSVFVAIDGPAEAPVGS